jgi:hypothetical protein
MKKLLIAVLMLGTFSVFAQNKEDISQTLSNLNITLAQKLLKEHQSTERIVNLEKDIALYTELLELSEHELEGLGYEMNKMIEKMQSTEQKLELGKQLHISTLLSIEMTNGLIEVYEELYNQELVKVVSRKVNISCK